MKKLYYQDSYLTQFKAEIKEKVEKDNRYHVCLNQTAFYPEGGGQPADRGTIAGIEVEDVYEKNGSIYHILKEFPDSYQELECQVDWENRFDHMQQHTGQHLLSALLLRDYQAQTVGFHLGKERVTIDIDREISLSELKEVEKRANTWIYNNKAINTFFPDKGNLDKYNLQKSLEVEGNIRLVNIEGLDTSPCGGTHLSTTGQLGLLKIINVSSYKQGLRLTFLCGKRALNDYDFKNELTAEARDLLSVKDEDIICEIKRLLEEKETTDKELADCRQELLSYRADDLIASGEKVSDYTIVKKTFFQTDYNSVQLMAEKIIEGDNKIVIMGQEGKSARLIMGRSENINDLNMSELIKEPLEMLNGGGGGSPQLAQGGGSAGDKLLQAVQKAYYLIINRLETDN